MTKRNEKGTANNSAATWGQNTKCNHEVAACVEAQAIYHIQETIGGWKQTAVFSGTLEECEEYFESMHLDYGNNCYSIVSDEDYRVDYL